MRTSAIVCAMLAGTLGISSAASAQGAFRHGDRGDRGDRTEHRQIRSAERENQWRNARQAQRREDRSFRQGWQAGRQFNQPHYVYQQPRYVYNQPSYRATRRFYRGGYLPYEYRRPAYYVNDWNAYSGLYAPPYGYQWMNVDGDFLLVALATGLIANALVNGY